MDLTDLQNRLRSGQLDLRFTDHALVEARKDGLTAKDLEDAATHGEMIEDYGVRALLLNVTEEDALPCHIVVEYDPTAGVEATVVTAYLPESKEWQKGWKRRKRGRR
ncbi:MAG: DUF4258 domain-containing protein [Candidatus Binatia bacterium]